MKFFIQIWFGTGNATNLYLNQRWSCLLTHKCVTRPRWVKWRHMVDKDEMEILKSIETWNKNLYLYYQDYACWWPRTTWCLEICRQSADYVPPQFSYGTDVWNVNIHRNLKIKISKCSYCIKACILCENGRILWLCTVYKNIQPSQTALLFWQTALLNCTGVMHWSFVYSGAFAVEVHVRVTWTQLSLYQGWCWR